MTSRFARDTAVTAHGGGRYRATIEPAWRVERPNGGYVAALLLRAITTEVDDAARPPRSMTVHYLRPPDDGETDIDVTVERAGRSMSTVSARLSQGGRTMALALVALGAGRDGQTYESAPPPDLPPPEECDVMPPPPVPIPIREQIEARHALGPLPFSGGDEAVTGGWMRLVDPEPTDAHVLVQAVDAWIPAYFGVATSHPGIPTVDLTVHFRQAPVAEDDWLLVRFRTRLAAEGYVEEDGEIWDRSGRLLAQSRQLAILVT